MPKYNYVAMDQKGKETKGTLEVATQNEAITRVKEMGLLVEVGSTVRVVRLVTEAQSVWISTV